MSAYVDISGKHFNLITSYINKELFNGSKRRVCTITLSDVTYSDIIKVFVEECKWSIVQSDVSYDYGDYNIPGPVTDNRDGTVTLKMAEKYTEAEILSQKVDDLSESLKIVCGTSEISTNSAVQVRQTIEALYVDSNITNSEKIVLRNLCPIWSSNLGQVDVGSIYRTVVGVNTSNPLLEQVWKCRQSYNTSEYPDIYPDNEQTWRTFNIPLHGTSIESAMPWVRPTMAEDTYKKGEFMVYTDGKYYESLRDTDKSPDEYSADWKCHSN